MTLRQLIKWGLPVVAAVTIMSLADQAAAQQSCPGTCPPPDPCDTGCPPPPPPPPPDPCDTGCPPPPPPPCEDDCPPPPCEEPDDCDNPDGPDINININLDNRSRADASARAQGRVDSFSVSRGERSTIGYGRGYGGNSVAYAAPTMMGNVVVQGPARVVRVPYQERRRMERRVVIRAVCMDARSVPHPASRIRPDRDIRDDYEGELYRCIAGSTLLVTYADYDGGAFNFDGGQTISCRAGEALYHSAGGMVECRPQTQERDCFERSLLRRFGAGEFVLTMIREELYEEYREETVVETYSGMSLVLDGGVGGRVH